MLKPKLLLLLLVHALPLLPYTSLCSSYCTVRMHCMDIAGWDCLPYRSPLASVSHPSGVTKNKKKRFQKNFQKLNLTPVNFFIGNYACRSQQNFLVYNEITIKPAKTKCFGWYWFFSQRGNLIAHWVINTLHLNANKIKREKTRCKDRNVYSFHQNHHLRMTVMKTCWFSRRRV